MKTTIPAAALDQHVAILGKTGAGKTFAAKGLVEHLLGQKRQVCVVDPTSAWWGLRLAADGKGKGFDVVLLGGEHGDIPLSERSGEAVARLVTEQGASVVLDTGGMTVGEYTRWFIDFAGGLYTTIRNPLHLVIDEAHYFMPQARTLSVDGGKMLHNGNRLMSGGRSRGIRGMMITQRPAKLHKDSLTCADTLIAMRMVAPQDRGAVKDWIDGAGDPVQGKAVLDSLAQLQRGEGWVWYPEGGYLERTKFPAIRTFDSSAAPKHGQGTGPKVAAINLDEVRAAMAEAVKEAEANDPKLLKAEIARLRKEVAAKAPAADPADLKAEHDRGYAAGVAAENRRWTSGVNGYGAELQRHGAATVKVGEALTGLVGTKAAVSPSPRIVQGPPRIAPPPRQTVSQPGRVVSADGELTGPEQRILNSLAWFEGIGVDNPENPAVAFMAGYTLNGSYFNARGKLNQAGRIEYTGDDRVKLTEAGRELAQTPDTPGTAEALHEHVLARLGGPEQRILKPLLAAYPDSVPNESLAESAGYTLNGSFFNARGRLRSLGLIEYRQGKVVARDLLFPAK